MESPWFHQNLKLFKKLKENPYFEFIFVDGGSQDKTDETCIEAGFKTISLPGSNRAERLKKGHMASSGDFILFHHPRSTIDPTGWKELQELKVSWGGFTHKFDQEDFFYRFTSWYSNQIRLKLKNIVYLDHCLFFHKSLMLPEDINPVPIFEDTLISYHLRKKSPPILLKGVSKTSSIRFEKNGFLKQALINQKAKIDFYLKKKLFVINTNYEKGLELNQSKSSTKFKNPLVTAKGENRASVKLNELKTLWFNTGTLCNLECKNCYIESSPKNDRLQYLTPEELIPYLEECHSDLKTVQLIGLTGGEPFLNPHIMTIVEEILKRGFPLLILTNAYRVLKKHKEWLRIFLAEYGDQLKIRVSLDHHSQEGHEKERGLKTFLKTLEEIKWLSDSGFCLSIAGRTLFNEEPDSALKGYLNLLKSHDIDWNLTPEKLALFPEMDLKKDVPEITTACWGILGKSPNDQMCASERMIVHRKGKQKAEVMPCTLLAYEDQFSLGESLRNAKEEVSLNHPFCAQFCVLGGASCSAQK